MKKKRKLIGLGVVIALFAGAVFMRDSVSKTEPATLGIASNGQLQPLPNSPNAVASYEKGYYAQQPPLEFSGEWQAARDKLSQIIEGMPRTALVTVEDRYIHATFRSRLWGFVDDVEFLYVPDEHLIHYRSASRVGKGDLGVNEQRMAEIRQRWEEK